MYSNNPLGMSQGELEERAKWEMFPSVITSAAGKQPGRPYAYRQYPRMLYRAQRVTPGLAGAGKIAVALVPPRNVGFQAEKDWDLACQAVEGFNGSCRKVVEDDSEFSRAMEDGWRPSAQDALDHAEAREREVSNVTHLRQAGDRTMSEKAQSEAATYEADNFGHQPEIPAAKKRGGRPKKVVPSAS